MRSGRFSRPCRSSDERHLRRLYSEERFQRNCCHRELRGALTISTPMDHAPADELCAADWFCVAAFRNRPLCRSRRVWNFLQADRRSALPRHVGRRTSGRGALSLTRAPATQRLRLPCPLLPPFRSARSILSCVRRLRHFARRRRSQSGYSDTFNWNLDTQYAITPSLMFEIGYVGDRTEHTEATLIQDIPVLASPTDPVNCGAPFGCVTTNTSAQRGAAIARAWIWRGRLYRNCQRGLFQL